MTGRLPELWLADWNPTRDTLHQYARIIGKIRGRYSPEVQALVAHHPRRVGPGTHHDTVSRRGTEPGAHAGSGGPPLGDRQQRRLERRAVAGSAKARPGCTPGQT